MQKFILFKKTKTFYWTTNKIYYCILLSVIGLSFIAHELFHLAETKMQWLIITNLLIGLVLKFRGLIQIEPLRGTLEGSLIFDTDSITIGEKSYLLQEINKIQIENDDYSGKLIHTSKGNIGAALSNGTNNYIVLFLKSKETKKYQFELLNSNDFQNVRTNFTAIRKF